MTQQRSFAGVLFDLDGTLLDTAPDLLASLDYAMQQHGVAPVDKERIKPFISYLIAKYGYLKADDEPSAWGADGCVTEPLEILSWLN